MCAVIGCQGSEVNFDLWTCVIGDFYISCTMIPILPLSFPTMQLFTVKSRLMAPNCLIHSHSFSKESSSFRYLVYPIILTFKYEYTNKIIWFGINKC